MRTRLKHAASFLLALLPAVGLLHAQSSARARVMVLIDTSGSMGSRFTDPTMLSTPPNGDYPGGDGSFAYTDQGLNNAFMYPGKNVLPPPTCSQADRSRCDGLNSRLYAAKSALTKAVSGYGTIDFGLMSFGVQLCPFNTPRCETCQLFDCTFGCVPCTNNCTSYTCLYANSAFTALSSINWLPQSCSGAGAGKVIVTTSAGSGARILPWLDGVEDHRSSGDMDNSYGTGSTPINPELRADGDSPLAESINLARTGWYDVVKAADPIVNCRRYRLVLVTDSAESAGGGCGASPVTAAQTLYNDNPTNHVLTHVISLAPATDTTTRTLHSNIAAAGGTGAALFVTSAAELEAALGDIVNKIPLSDCSPTCP